MDSFKFHSTVAGIHKSQIDTSCLLLLLKKTDTGSETVNFISKPGVFFRSVELNDFMNSFISCGMASPHLIAASDFAIRKVSVNPNKGRLSIMNLKSLGPAARQTITVKVKCRIPSEGLFKGQ